MKSHTLLLVLLVACASTEPSPYLTFDEQILGAAPAVELRLADYDGDGVLDTYAIRGEHCSGPLNGCPGEKRWRNWVVILKGGSNGNEALRRVVWASDHPITATGWVMETGDLAVKIGGKWERVPWTAPKGRRDD